MLLPYDLKEWIPENDIVHFTIEAAQQVPLELFQINENGTGDAQYHPHMLLALLLYCYSHGVFSSRRIEKMTWKDVAVRYICANSHPDHDTICAFRVNNEKAITEAFFQILRMAREMGILRVGTVSVDGTKIKANASIYKSVRYDRAVELEKQLTIEIESLMKQAKTADDSGLRDPDELQEDLSRLENLRAKMKQAKENLEKRAKEKAEQEKKTYQGKVDRRNNRHKGKGPKIKPPQETPQDEHQSNLTDDDSRIMRKSIRHECTQSYNAQAVVDADGTMLVLGTRVTNNANDKKELCLDIQAIPSELGVPKTILADKGYGSEVPIEALQKLGVEVLVSVTGEGKNDHRRFDWKPASRLKMNQKFRTVHKAWIKKMNEKMKGEREKELYKKRKQTVEPVFGIIKQVLGFRQFLLRGLEKVNLEWQLVTCAFNLKKLAKLKA